MRHIGLVILVILVSGTLLAGESEGMRVMRLGCEKQKIGLGCFNYANMLIRSKLEGADRYFQLGCEFKHEGSCTQERWDIPERNEVMVSSQETDSLADPTLNSGRSLASLETGEDATLDKPDEEFHPISSESLRSGVSVIKNIEEKGIPEESVSEVPSQKEVREVLISTEAQSAPTPAPASISAPQIVPDSESDSI